MDSINTSAVTIKSADYKDNDKLLTLLTPEYGKIMCTAKGIRKKDAKLKSAALPFCFGEFSLAATSGGLKTLTGCLVTDSFFDLTSRYDRYLIASTVLEAAERCCEESIPAPAVFVAVLKCLNTLAYSDADAKAAAVVFALRLFDALGLRMTTDVCAVCGSPLTRSRFDAKSGGTVCSDCPSPYGYALTNETAAELDTLSKIDDAELDGMTFGCTDILYRLMYKSVESLFDVKLNSFCP